MRKRFSQSILLISIIGLSLLIYHYASLAAEKKTAPSALKEAMYYDKLENKNVQCVLCPRRCTIPDGRRGFCRARENRGGALYSLVYGRPCAVHVDPIEKKPLAHVLPGTKSFSIATAGCNLACKFCQNWQISQASPEDVPYTTMMPEDVVRLAKENNCPTIAYTYTEPTVFYEYMLDTAIIARKEGVMNVMHSAGFINEEPLRRLCKYLDAANIDLKGSDKFYNEMCLGKREDVLRSLKILKEEGVWIEITYLVVPTLNDSMDYVKETAKWIHDNLGPDTPLHISRFWPTYKLTNLSPTPVSTLEQARGIAIKEGLRFVYVGNIPSHKGETTYCPHCGEPVIERQGYNVVSYNLEGGRCKFCGTEVAGIWKK